MSWRRAITLRHLHSTVLARGGCSPGRGYPPHSLGEGGVFDRLAQVRRLAGRAETVQCASKATLASPQLSGGLRDPSKACATGSTRRGLGEASTARALDS
jgi:hypothetical protein